MINRIAISLFLIFLFSHSLLGQSEEKSLAGQWRFQTDEEDRGIDEKWFDKKFNTTILLPGSMNSNNLGNPVTIKTKWTGWIYDSSFFFQPRLAKYRTDDNYKVPFWLTPLKYYSGAAWYQKEIIIPAGWANKKINLFLERIHIQSKVWLDDMELTGINQNSLSAPHEYILPDGIKPGAHTISIRIDNRINDIDVGVNSHSISDHTQGNWNGIVGKMYLQAEAAITLQDIRVFPDIVNKKALVRMVVKNNSASGFLGKIKLRAKSFNASANHTVPGVLHSVNIKSGETKTVDIDLPIGNKMQLWSEFHPALYLLTTTIENGDIKDEKTVQFGMREVKVVGKNITVNSVPIFLRGNLNNCEFPLTGFPATDEAAWVKIYRVLKSYGLNHVRFHSWCPPEAAFAAADKAGIYLQVEAPTWPNHSTSLGDGKFIDQYIYDETNRIEKYYGNYASFIMLAAGNEPRGGRQVEYLTNFIKYWKEKDSRRIYTGASVAMSWPLVPSNEYMIKSGARNLNWVNASPESTSDYSNAVKDFTMPYITHEQGQWCVFPDFSEIKKYTGDYRAKNFELFQEDLKDQGMGNEARKFLMASGKLQALCYKYEIEKSLRTPGLSGFQLLGLQDFPGQGTALVGVVNVFYQPKGYISPQQFKQFCNSTVPLSRIEKFVYTNNETFKAAIELFHYEENPLQASISWLIKDESGTIVKKGNFTSKTYPVGNCLLVGNIVFPLQDIKKAKKLTVEV
ncbi:MAG: sugar-binding domain-containing protein, partial [Niabella sp.]